MSKKGDSSKTESTTIALLSFSIFIATANQIMYKQTLNAFSSPHSNYGFFVNQFSSAMYTVQAVVVSGLLVWREPGSLSEALRAEPIWGPIMGTVFVPTGEPEPEPDLAGACA